AGRHPHDRLIPLRRADASHRPVCDPLAPWQANFERVCTPAKGWRRRLRRGPEQSAGAFVFSRGAAGLSDRGDMKSRFHGMRALAAATAAAGLAAFWGAAAWAEDLTGQPTP